MAMRKKFSILTQEGFTLIELLSVMVIMSVFGSVAVQKFDALTATAGERGIQFTVRELNIRESLTWTNAKLSDSGWVNDAEIFAAVDKNIGSDYTWNPGPAISGGTLHFRSDSLVLTRTPSSKTSAGRWSS
jgi:prepilin-type N-terminal cleavage/methylation domain-containing protein